MVTDLLCVVAFIIGGILGFLWGYIFGKEKPTPFTANKVCGMSSLQSNENTAGEKVKENDTN